MYDLKKPYRGFIFILYILLISIGATAQKPAYYKMSSLVREAVLEDILQNTNNDNKLYNNKVKVQQSSITAFVKINADNPDEIIKKNKCKKITKIGDVYILSIPLSCLSDLSNCMEVERIEAGKGTEVQLDTTINLINAKKVHEGYKLPERYTGKGVVVGVQDIGFDLTHPTFYSPNMDRYRIKALWDQLSVDTINSPLPVGRDYTSEKELLAIGHTADGLSQTHGTHTAGIAAGSGAEGNGVISPYKGLAYNADIVMVANATGDNANLINKKDYYKYTYATDALGFKYIFDYADKIGEPCVINFSEGGHQDLTGEDILYSEVLSHLIGPGHIMVASAGNDADLINYMRKDLGTESVGLFMKGQNNKVHFTAKSRQQFELKLTIYDDNVKLKTIFIPTLSILDAKDSTLVDSLVVEHIKYIWKIVAYKSAYNNKEIVYDIYISSPTSLGDNIQHISIELCGRYAEVELYRISGYLVSLPKINPKLTAGDNSRSIHSPSSFPDVISVGATGYREGFVNYLGQWKYYPQGNDGRRTSFSGVGPTIDGRIKPDVVAPGQNIVSAYSSFFINNPQNAGGPLSSDIRHFNYNGSMYAWNSNAGTSMSAPIVAGAIALWLQVYPKLTPNDCIEIFKKTCTHYDNALYYPNNYYGYGQINVYEGIKEVLKKASLGITTIEGKDNNYLNDRIYSLNGCYLGDSEVNLPKGIYVRNGKKLIKN